MLHSNYWQLCRIWAAHHSQHHCAQHRGDLAPGQVGHHWQVPQEQTPEVKICYNRRWEGLIGRYSLITCCSAEILTLCDSFSLENREFYFDRSPRIFENILGLYRKGELHLTESVCPRDFLGELDYWGLSALHLGKNIFSQFTNL